MKKLNIFIVLLFSSLMTKSQIVIDNNPPYDNTTWLVDNILLGGGIIVSNHSFIGDPNQIGFFNGINSNLDIDSGIVLSSGSVLDLVGPNASGSTSTNFLLPGDPTLDVVIAPDLTNDAAVLEFDFIPTSDTISFKYVFGSEEYLEFVNNFNDAFGFFLTGPNPSGGNYVDQNLAIVPGTANTPVTINNINDVVNSAYYVDNGDGFTAPQNTDAAVIQFDGFTKPLTAIAAVNCGDTYHIKLVVADAVDGAWDSGIFLEAGSFYSPPLSIADDLGIDSTIMNIPCNSTVTLTASGGMGATYQWFDSTSIVFDTNSSVTVGEGVYIVSADISGCAVLSDTLRIIEGDLPTFDLGSDTNISCNSSYLLIPEIIGGTTPYSYLWSNGSTIGSQNLLDGNYYLLVTDFYGCSANDTIEVTYDVPPILDLGTDTTIACNSSYLLIPNITGGVAPYSYLWSNGSTLISQTLGEGDYDLIVTDFYGCEDNSSILITYDLPPVVDLGSDYTIACNTTTTLIPNVLGGTQPYTYEWNDGSENSNLSVAQGNYSITVTDFYGCLGSDVVDILEDAPGTVTLSGGTSICADGSFAEINFNFNGLFPWDLVFSNGLINQTIQQLTDSNYLFTTSNDGIYNIVSAADANDCLANIVGAGTAQVIVHPLPVAIISPAEISIYEGDAIELEVGEYAMYQWFNTEGLLNLDTLSTLTVSDSGIFYVEVIDFNGCSDVSDDAIVYTKPYTNLFIPNAFTPNGDDHNELFVISGVNIKTFNIKIFNRWGELMFLSESIDKSWDGTFDNKKVQEGTYYYSVKVLGDDDRMLELSGNINIIY